MRSLYLLLVLGVIVSCAAPQPRATKPAAQATPGSSTPVPQVTGTGASGEQLLALARDQQLVGEYAPMEVTLHLLAQQHPSPAIQRETEFRLAEAAFLRHDPGASSGLQVFLARSAQHDVWYTQALFLVARAQEDAGDHRAAIMAYARYRDLHTLLEPYAMLHAAAQQAAAGDQAGEITTLEAVAAQPIARSQRAAVLEQLISLDGAANNPAHLLARYTDLLAIANKPDYRAKVLWRASQVASGDQRQRWLLQLVNELPLEPAAADAAEALGSQLAPYTAARILHWHDRWAAAIPLFDAALQGQLAPQDRFEAQRLRALDLRGTRDFAAALQALGALAQARPTSPATLQAELDYVQTVGQSGNQAWAIQGYRRFAQAHPNDPLAAEALWRVVQLQQGDDMATSIASAEQLGHSYPKSEQAHTALSQAALFRYEHGAYDAAVADWQLLATGADAEASAEGYFWAGVTLLERNKAGEAQQALVAADAAAPASYYAARARELLKQGTAGGVPLGIVATVAERQAVEQWLQNWLGTPVPAVDAAWLPDLLQAPAVERALALAAVDLRDEANDEWFAAAEAWNTDPVHLWQLALLANREGYAYPALTFAERIVDLSPDKRITKATPVGLLRLIYPTPYARVVSQYAAQATLDPRLLYGLLRQESLFNPDATSWVGARGLAQVMPATAEGIAQALSIAGFQSDQLYQPALAIQFGAHYLGHQIQAFGGNIQAAAAAYNGGPGNAQRWLEQTSNRDLFTELIDYHESREYVKLVYGNWGMYRALYHS